jgi:hypothetical protein
MNFNIFRNMLIISAKEFHRVLTSKTRLRPSTARTETLEIVIQFLPTNPNSYKPEQPRICPDYVKFVTFVFLDIFLYFLVFSL